jgi:hypothetical protein
VWRDNRVPELIGTGIYARTVMENFPQLPVVDETGLEDASLRDNFIQRVFALYRRQQLAMGNMTEDNLQNHVQALTDRLREPDTE